MDEKKLNKLIKATYDLIDLEEKKHELFYQLLEALTVKDYKDKNPDAKSVVLASYHIKNKNTNEISKHPELECVASNDHKRLDRLQRKYFSQYRKLKLKSYDLTKFIPDKTIATCKLIGR